MGNLYESLRTIMRGNTPQRATQVDDEIPIIGTDMNDAEIMEFINKVKTLSTTRKEKLKDYDYMSKDAIVGGALELISDECSLLDDTTKLPFWVESDNQAFEKYMNKWLKDTIKIDKKVWLYAYRILRDGDIAFRTFNSINDEESVDETLKKLITVGDYFELVDDISNLNELTLYGKTTGYQLIDPTFSDNNRILSDDDFIRVYRDTGEREEVKAKYLDESTGQHYFDTFKVPIGTSFLDSSRQAFMILDLLDTMVLSQRINKNQILRLISVEVAQAGKKETKKIIDEVKRALKITSLEKDKAYKEGNKNSTISNVYVPTRNGKGNMSVEEIGGNVDVKDLADLDYYTNKLFASIRVPKDFLGFGEGGFFSEGSMTRKDVRFARMVKSVKLLISDIVYQMVEFKKSKTKWNTDDIKYHIDTVNVPSAEDGELIDSLNTSVVTADSIKTFLEGNPNVDAEELTKYLLKRIVKLPKVDEFMSEEEIPEESRVKPSDMDMAQLQGVQLQNQEIEKELGNDDN